MTVETCAQLLRKAQSTRNAIAPLSEIIGKIDVEKAYKIQQTNTDIRIAAGAHIVGKKIGLTSHAVQKQLGVDQPDFGILFDDMEVLNYGFLSVKELMQPKVEGEVAFVLKKDLDSTNLTIANLIQSIDFAVPSIEIVGSRIKDWKIKITDTIADNASASHFLIGHQPKKLTDFDMINTKMVMKINGEIASTGKGVDCIGSPLNATLWLAQKMIELGTPLRAGEVIFSGALGPFVDVNAGDFVEISFSGLGTVGLTFTE